MPRAIDAPSWWRASTTASAPAPRMKAGAPASNQCRRSIPPTSRVSPDRTGCGEGTATTQASLRARTPSMVPAPPRHAARHPCPRRGRRDTTGAVRTPGRITYVGHATVLAELGGIRILTDPLLRRRLAHVRRRVPLPEDAELMPV